ncbi:phage tail protein [Pseudophaeobacter flagellatus]|uniref:phage tail protein n=1 Tax=Pseudophaeobacter flagellatus TaxID=2899119 RepID=UPI001E57CBCA|nr:phage tail protein [Pseudophaeobacter flagellatus]MCD9147822.1 tail fiber protein [Pseudophaeobacter flagellatus]
MAGLQEQSTWEGEVYQIEETDPVHAGPPDLDAGKGHTNVPHAQLANRTLWLKAQIEALTAQAILAMLKGVDGAGSGLDADLLDGIQAQSFYRNDQSSELINLGGEKRVNVSWAAAGNRLILAPRLADGSAWDWNAEFGFSRDSGAWYCDTPLEIEGYTAFHAGDAANEAQTLAGQAGKLVLAQHLAAAIAEHINALLDGAPAAMDTLKELADAIGDNDNELAALVGQVAGKLDAGQFTAATILQMLVDQKIGTAAAYIEGNEIAWETGVNRITSNDGGGNVQIRFGHRSAGDNVFTHDGTAFYIGGNLDSANGNLSLKVAKNGGAGVDEPVIWGDELTITKGDILFGGVSLRTHCGMLSPFDLTTPPAGWLECNGAAISRTSYSSLFDAIGTRHGNGDGATTFNLPDYRGEFIRGWDHGRGVDAGRALGSAQGDMLKAHQHGQTGALGSGGNLSNYTTNSSEGSTVTALNNETGSTGGTETRPRNLAAMICIKY